MNNEINLAEGIQLKTNTKKYIRGGSGAPHTRPLTFNELGSTYGASRLSDLNELSIGEEAPTRRGYRVYIAPL